PRERALDCSAVRLSAPIRQRLPTARCRIGTTLPTCNACTPRATKFRCREPLSHHRRRNRVQTPRSILPLRPPLETHRHRRLAFHAIRTSARYRASTLTLLRGRRWPQRRGPGGACAVTDAAAQLSTSAR